MTGKGRAARRSEWQDSAEEIPRKRARENQRILNLTEVCGEAGLKSSAVMSYVNRTGVGRRDVPMTHLARPAYKVGAVPYWSQDQLDAYLDAKAEQSKVRAEKVAALPEVSQEDAEQRGWWSLRRMAAWSGFAVVTLHRMATQEGFPEPVAVVPSNGPNPHVVRDKAAVEEWLRATRPNWEPTGEQESDDSRVRPSTTWAAKWAEIVAGLPELTPEEAEKRGWWLLPRIAAWAGYAPTTLRQMANEGEFPAPVAVMPSSAPYPQVLWDQQEVEAWLRATRPNWTPAEEPVEANGTTG